MYKWKRHKQSGNKCSKCDAIFPDDEFDSIEDMCDYCLFPETSGKKPSEIKYYYGDPLNITDDEEMLDNIDRIPEKQSKQAIESKRRFEYAKHRKV